MCVIIWAPEGTIPKSEIIESMKNNPHGWGFTVATGSRLVVYKSVNYKHFFKAWFSRPEGPVLFHARYATHGTIKRDNCHPFKMENHDLVVAHNGIIPKFGHATLSDTRDFIDKVLEPMPEWFLEEQSILLVIEKLIGNYSKMVFLNDKAEAVIINEDAGFWMSRRWYSNHTAFSRSKLEKMYCMENKIKQM